MAQTQEDIRAAYDVASGAYAKQFVHELDHKPFDRELLARFANEVGRDKPVLDLGCGPGHTTAFLHNLGLRVTGVDLSPGMISQANGLFPDVSFCVGNFFSLDDSADSICGLVAFYCIVNHQAEELDAVFAEMHRVLYQGGILLLAFHVGSGQVLAEQFLGTKASLTFSYFDPETIQASLKQVGFGEIEVIQRDPYDTEYPSQRCYMMAKKQA